MAELKVSNVIDVLSKSFSSVDLRIAAIKETNWVLVTSSVVLSHLQPEEIRRKHKSITQKIDKVLGYSLCFFLLTYPMSQWQNIVDQFGVGRIRADSIDIMVNAVDISNLTVNDNYPNPPYVKEDEWKVVGAEAILQGNGKKFSTTMEECRGNAKVLGYTDAYELTREILRIREYHANVDRYVVLGIPIYARILSHTVKGKQVIVTTKLHAGLRNIQLNLSAQTLDSRGISFEPFYRTTCIIKGVNRPHEEQFAKVDTTIRVSNEKPFQFVEATLIHRLIPVITISDFRETVHLERPTEPFATALSQFCPPDVFESRLMNPEDSKEELGPAEVFEDAVAWLLSLHGYSVIHLRKNYEHLRGPTGYEFGSLDIIAHKPGRLLLVDCDTSLPDEKKRNSLLGVRERLMKSAKGLVMMVPAVFTPRDCSQIQGIQSGVVVVDRSRLQKLYDDSMRGKINDIEFG